MSPLVATEFAERSGEVSPDGKWLAYDSNETGRFEVYVRPFPDVRAGKWPVSSGGGSQPLWARARSSRELFYRGPDGSLMSVRWDVVGGQFDTARPIKIVDGERYATGAGFRQYDITPDGTRFLMIKKADDLTVASDVLIVVQHWEEELKRLLPRK